MMLHPGQTLRTPAELAEAGLISFEQRDALMGVAERYAIAVTPALADLIDPGDPDDPIRRQFIPDPAELQVSAEEHADPIGDARHTPVAGIVHRYPDRVLLKLTHLCPVYCRFCFRREMVGPGKSDALDAAALDSALAYIGAHQEIWEVILTGGDPFILTPRRIADVTKRLAGFSHVKVLRWHTRVPVAAPERITLELLRALRRTTQAVYVVLHANHPRELAADARAACARIVDAGIPMLSQSVLLKSVNDRAEILEELMRSFVELRIKPYYLHHADLAPGTGRFRTEIEHGQSLMRQLHATASGLCQPDYVLDIPGGYAKARLSPSDIETRDGQQLRDSAGAWHDYPPRTSSSQP